MATAYPPSATPVLWNNRDIVLYHGTIQKHADSILKGIDIQQSRVKTDFGQGFYVTTLKRQAEGWASKAHERVRLRFRQNEENKPVLVKYEIPRDDLAPLESLWFVRGAFDADDYWSLVFHCRQGKPGHARFNRGGRYDIVIGPVASQWRQRLTIADVDQISFHTDRAIALLVNPSVLPVR